MTSSSPVCACLVQHNFWDKPYYNYNEALVKAHGLQTVGLTDEEKECLKHLTEAWNSFMLLGNKHPDDNQEFRPAIHEAQKTIATRVARRVNPDIWNQY